MSFNKERYLNMKAEIRTALARGGNPFDYMLFYKKAIKDEDYEKAKSITECLRPLNYETSDTHMHISCLNIDE